MEIKWGVIGCGSVLETKVGPALNEIEHSSFEYVMSRDEKQTYEFAKKHNVKKWTVSASEMIDSNDINAVYVATPPESHFQYAKMVADSGKFLLVEKPLARNLEEAEELIDYCKKRKVKVFVAYYRRSLPRFNIVKKWLESKTIGRICYVHIQHSSSHENHPVSPLDSNIKLDVDSLPWRFNPKISGGGNFVDCGTHMLDMVDYLLGPISNVKGAALNQDGLYPAEDTVFGNFLINKVIPCSGQWNYGSGIEVDRIEIVGSKGAIRLSLFDESPLELETSEGVKYFDEKNPQYWHQPFIQSVVNELREKGKCPSTGENAIRAMRVKNQFLSDYYR